MLNDSYKTTAMKKFFVEQEIAILRNMKHLHIADIRYRMDI